MLDSSSQPDTVLVSQSIFGTLPDGREVPAFTLRNEVLEVRILAYGGIVQSLKVIEGEESVDVALGFDTLEGYLSPANPFMGCLVGRFANRIAEGRFSLDNQDYFIPVNNGPNALHGGVCGFDKVLWEAAEIPGGVELRYRSMDGDQGFPGTLDVIVHYTLEGSALRIDYEASTDAPTVVNLTNHLYFNLAGKGDILDHELRLESEAFTPVDPHQIPTGEIQSVAGGPFDFRTLRRVGESIDADNEQIRRGGGYDHNWVLKGGELSVVAVLREPASGRVMETLTTEPGVQLYTGNFLGGFKGKAGGPAGRRSGLCLETQHYPDAPNKPTFPSTVLRHGEVFRSTTAYRFS